MPIRNRNIAVDAAINGSKLDTDTIAAGQIAAGAVGTSELGASSVTTAKIADSNVNSKKLDSNVTAAKLAASSVLSGKLSLAETAIVISGTNTAAKVATPANFYALVGLRSVAKSAGAADPGRCELALNFETGVTEIRADVGTA